MSKDKITDGDEASVKDVTSSFILFESTLESITFVSRVVGWSCLVVFAHTFFLHGFFSYGWLASWLVMMLIGSFFGGIYKKLKGNDKDILLRLTQLEDAIKQIDMLLLTKTGELDESS